MIQLRPSRAEAADDDPDIPVSSPGRPVDRSRQAIRGKGDVRRLVVGREVILSGEITSCDKLIIEGKVEGNLIFGQDVKIYESGSFTGSALTEEVEISGRFEGNLIVHNRLLIKASGQVSGTIRYGQIEIEAGGRICGDIAPQPISERGGNSAEAMGRSLQAAFGRATKAAVAEAHRKGLAVPGRARDRAVEITPDGRQQPLDETRDWSPTDWKAKRNG